MALVLRYFWYINFSVLALLLLFVSCGISAEIEKSGDGNLISPSKALISPYGAKLEVRQMCQVMENSGLKIVEFIIPDDSENLYIRIPGQTIARWSFTPALINASGFASTERERIILEKDNLQALLETLKARISVWENQTGAATAQELEKRQSLMQEDMPALAKEQERLKRRLANINRELANMPASEQIAKKVVVILIGNPRVGEQVEVFYSYDLKSCGWQAEYDFSVNAEPSRDTDIKVMLFAEVWQYTGMDWKDTEITLATMGSGPREPQPLRRWIVGNDSSSSKPVPQPRAYNLAAKRALASGAVDSAAATMEDAIEVEAVATVAGNANSVYASWNLSVKGLPEGRSRVVILEDNWKTNLEWLARPTQEDNRVWILAKYMLPENQAWPAGGAQFNVNGQNVGNGAFMPKSREVTLYFGADPRVNVATTIDTSKQGETGFINTSKTWTGAWTYTISNEHNTPVKVKVERPSPMVTDERITVQYKNVPPATLDEKKHMLYWNVDVPAHGKSIIEHGIIISSPEKLPLFPLVN